MKQTSEYFPLPTDEDGSKACNEHDYRRFGRRKSTLLHWIVHAITLTTLLSVLAARVHDRGPSRATCWRMFRYYSPVDEAATLHRSIETRFKGSLWYQSPFKGPPTPQVEEAWHSIMQYGMIAVSGDDILRVGHNLSAAQFPPSVGGGYIAATVGTHQLHCLHYIWQDHHRAAFPAVQQKIDEIPEMYERHYEHCVDYIRQSLMCDFDTGILPYNWVRDHQNPTPNANTMHKCVDWDGVQTWLAKRAVAMPDDFQWRQPDDAISLPWNP